MSSLFDASKSAAALPGDGSVRRNPLTFDDVNTDDSPVAAPDSRHADVVVIGGGLSGLTAALTCIDAGVSNVLVLEAKNRVGGRTLTVDVETVAGPRKMDLGGQWIGRTQRDALSMLKRFGLELHPQYRSGQTLMRLADKIVRKFNGTIPELSMLQLINLQLVQTMIDRHAALVNRQDLAKTPRAAEFDSYSVASMIARFNIFDNIRGMMDVVCRVSFGCESDQMSYLFFISYIAATGNFDALLENSEGGGQEFRIKGGAMQLSERMLGEIGRDRVRLLCPVVEVVHDDAGVTVTCADGSVIKAQHVIFAIPPHLVGGVTFYPPLPLAKRAITENSSVGHLIKILVTFKTAFWRAAGLSGEGLFNTGLLCVCFDASLHDEEPAMVCFIGGDNATRWAAQPASSRQAAVLAELATLFGPEVHSFLAYAEKDWTSEPFNGGCPVDRFVTGTRFIAHALAEPVGRLHFAGTETAVNWKGFMSGAIQAGRRAAGEVLADLAPSWVAPTLETVYPVPAYHYPAVPRKSAVSASTWAALAVGAASVLFAWATWPQLPKIAAALSSAISATLFK